MNVFTSLVLVLFRPITFWLKLDANQRLRRTIEYLLFLIAVLLIWDIYVSYEVYQRLVSWEVVRAVGVSVTSLLSIILMVVLLRVFLFLIKQRIDLYQASLLVMYSYTPSIIFSYFLPSVIEAIYTFILMFLGFRYFCKLPILTSCIAVILALVSLLISATAGGATLSYLGLTAS